MATILYYLSSVLASGHPFWVAVIEEHEEWLKVIAIGDQELRLMTVQPAVTEIGEIVTEFRVSDKLDYCLLPREQIEDALRVGKLWKKNTPPKFPLPPFSSMN